MALDKQKCEQIRSIFERFLQNRMRTIQRLKIEDLHINPFLLRILSKTMDFEDSEAIIRWLVIQRSMTGVTTSFGFCIQDVAKVFSEGTGVEGADIQKNKEGRHFHIQVKSGPSTMDKVAVDRMSQLMLSVQRRNRGSVSLLGMCYGTREQVVSTVKMYSGVDWLIGREFWEFISDDPDCVNEIYKIAGEVGDSFRGKEGRTLAELLEFKTAELKKQFDEVYASEGDAMWKKLLEKNS